MSEADKNTLLDSCKDLSKTLSKQGVSSKSDLRDNYSPGWKFNHWELKVMDVFYVNGLVLFFMFYMQQLAGYLYDVV